MYSLSQSRKKMHSMLVLLLGILVGFIVLGYAMGKIPQGDKPSSLKNTENTPVGYFEKAIQQPLKKFASIFPTSEKSELS